MSVANVATRWVLDRPAVGAVVVGTVDDRHMTGNLALFDLQLDIEDRARIAGVLDAFSEPPGDVYALERDWDGPHGQLLRTDLNSNGD